MHTNPIVRFAVDRRVTMAMCVVGVFVLGWLSMQRLPLEFFPTMQAPFISVYAPYPSSSPEETERLIVRPLEDILGTVNGVEKLTAVARAGRGEVNVEFADGTDMDMAAVEIRDRIDRISHLLPDDVERVWIKRRQSSDRPVLMFVLASPWDRDRLYRFVDEVVLRRLERLDGVADVDAMGLQARDLQVNLYPDRLAAHGVNVRDVSSVLRANNVNVSAGPIREGSSKYLVRVMGQLEDVEDVRALPVSDIGLRVDDVADVQLGYSDREEFSWLNGQETVAVQVFKGSTANLLHVVDQVRAEMDSIRDLPETADLNIRYFFDTSQDVRKAIGELRDTGLIGGALAVVFMFLFLRRFRTTLLVALAIPVSVIVTFVFMYLSRQAGWTDLTINVMTLMGLILAIGMLVDPSIVVIESIFRHRQDLAEDGRTAALGGASEVAMAIFASTLTTVCVFLPMIFLSTGGHFNMMIKNIGVTIIMVLVASLMVALTVVPMVASHLLDRESMKRHVFFDRFVGLYGRGLAFTLRHRFVFVLLILGALWGSWKLYGSIGRTFTIPSFDRQITMMVDTPSSYDVEAKRELYEQVYQILDEHRDELDISDIYYGFRRGSGRSRGWSRTNRFTLYLVDERESRQDTATIRDHIQELMPTIPGVVFTLSRSMKGPMGQNTGVDVELVGDRLEILEALSEQVMGVLQQMSVLQNVDSSLESDDEEIIIRPSRERALAAGLSSSAVGASVSAALSSRPVGYFRTGEEELDIRVQYREEERETLDQLKKLPVAFGRVPLPIGAVADFETTPGARAIVREDRTAIIHVSADTQTGTPLYMAARSVYGTLEGMEFPTGYGWKQSKQMRQSQQEEKDAWFVWLFAGVLIYMIMAALFESFAQPFTIMCSVPFAFIGVGIVLWLFGNPRSQITDTGVVILIGLVVNNAIVLVAHINHLRRTGMDRNDAIVLGGQHRLRPILMTALTTILGLSPMIAPFLLPQVFGSIEGRAAHWAPVGLVLLGGLTTSTFLTLTVTPTIYSLVDDVTNFMKRIAGEVAR
jgi:HAE1 family hydrophobic/amphiphilic exporter-1